MGRRYFTVNSTLRAVLAYLKYNGRLSVKIRYTLLYVVTVHCEPVTKENFQLTIGLTHFTHLISLKNVSPLEAVSLPPLPFSSLSVYGPKFIVKISSKKRDLRFYDVETVTLGPQPIVCYTVASLK